LSLPLFDSPTIADYSHLTDSKHDSATGSAQMQCSPTAVKSYGNASIFL
jgi:hypothetical protein